MPDAAGGHRDPALVEGGHRDLEALALLTEERGGGHAYVVEEQLGGGLAAQPELALDLAGLEAVGVGGHQERADALRSVATGAGEDQGHVGPGAVGDEELLAVDDVVAAVPPRPRREVAGVRAGVGLGEAEAAELGRARDARQPLLLLLLGAEPEDRLADQAVGHRHDPAQGGVGSAELLHAEHVGEVVAAEPAVLLGDGQPEETDLRHLRDDLEVDRLAPVPLGAVRHRLAVEERASQVAERLLLVTEAQVHVSPR